ncbi:MAG TPA: GMC family oxidoreductase [Coleofasciculaceae cyanobacterium]
MNLIDLRNFEDNSLIETDLCIVGSGPAGLSIAKEFIGTKIQVWIIESGGLEESPETQALYEIENVGVPRILEQQLVRNRIFGGTSHTWTGRCAPFDELDFQHRSWIPNSGWPIARAALEPYLERAGENLGIGPNCYDQQLWKHFKVAPPQPLIDAKLLKSQFWQFSKDSQNPGEPMRFGRNFIASSASPNIKILLHANVTHLNTNAAGTCLESVEVSTLEKKSIQIRAKAVVLACGGIENARLLLASNRIIPPGVGNEHDVVGRFLMDHPGCIVGSFDTKRSAKVQNRFGHYWLDNQQGRHVYLHGLALSPELQAKEQLLNCAAFLEQIPAQDDPWYALRRLKGAAKHEESALPWERAMPVHQEVLTILRQSGAVLDGVYRRFVKHRPSIIKAERVDLYCLVEQLPDPESRVTLSSKTDALGMPLSQLNWKISEQERHTVRRLSQLICQEFQRIGLPQPILSSWLNEEEGWQSHFTDRAHPIGTTRIAANPKAGVVDLNCQVHGVEGLFIAGSSVFPTTGHANPTLMLIAMSIRLADWLKANHFRHPAERYVSKEKSGIA